MKTNTVNYNSLEYLKSLLHPNVKIIDLEVRGKWLRATLSSGMYFSVINNISK